MIPMGSLGPLAGQKQSDHPEQYLEDASDHYEKTGPDLPPVQEVLASYNACD